ncbi:hypothetical protein [Rhizobium sp. CC-YZS058]|uniref:hypothetical protein n=1 Tax=Rhizobium sp. CC-YZS058 TaxID=3042153 RepID=UPI002B057268|nr:hypothetical protein [Rhizobium sp. CC-YZS058]MEA3533696.1 hypothetical protein [Rhizobium sp. CC-YZS058]
MKTIDIVCTFPKADVLARLQPEIDDIVNERLIAIGRRKEGLARTRVMALQRSINRVTLAVSQLEKAQFTPGERAATTQLIAAAKGLRAADAAYTKGQ